ncbi:hypothetical protein [Paludisphaera sp.]|uniref:hypothetical protein n=1 Tax=Paludisphaera sp. TaxID=2017432 RepID=UPI00301CF318
MLRYRDGTEIRTDDHVRHAGAPAFVEQIVDGDDAEDHGLEGPGFMLVCEQCGRVVIEVGTYDWQDVEFVRRGKGPTVRPSP